MKYFSKNKKWMAYLILLTFLFTSIMPSNLGSMNSVAEAAAVNNSQIVKWGGNTNETETSGTYSDAKEYQSYENGDLKIRKTIDGTETENKFNVTLEVVTTENLSEIDADPNAATVLVMDCSGSMAQNGRADSLKNAATNFIDSFSTVPANTTAVRNVAFVTFADHARSNQIWYNVVNTTQKSDAKSSLNQVLYTNGGTNIEAGLRLAVNLINAEKNKLTAKNGAFYLGQNADGTVKAINNVNIILLTDGNPTYHIANANQFKYNSGNSTGRLSDYGRTVATNEAATDIIYGNRGGGNKSTEADYEPVESLVKNTIKSLTVADSNVNFYSIAFDIGESTTVHGKTVYNWLLDLTGAGKTFTASNQNDLYKVFTAINTLITLGVEAWKVTDPMGEDILFDTEGYNKLPVSERQYNTLTYADDSKTLTWDLTSSVPTSSTENGKTHYTYQVQYPIILDTAKIVKQNGEYQNTFDFDKVRDTNGDTILYYYLFSKVGTNDTDFGKLQNKKFNVPEVKGFPGSFEFVKKSAAVIGAAESVLAGAKFKLEGTATGSGESVTLTATSDANGKVSFENIPAGNYTLTETSAPSGYIASQDSKQVVVSYGDTTVDGRLNPADVVVTNTPEIVEVVVSKVWDDANNQDGKRPVSITVDLLADGTKIDSATLTGSGDTWNHTFTNLVKYKNGQEITYTVKEVSVTDYTSETTGSAKDGYVITNTHTPEKTSISGEKTWDDNNNQDGKRPASITVNLFANGEQVDSKTVTEADDWKWSFTNLDKYADGKEIKYSITENEVKDYASDVNGYDIINTHTPETVTVEGTKTWDDNNNQDGLRPEEITVNLLKNGTVIDSQTVPAPILERVFSFEAENWTYKWTDLPKYENGAEIEYTITEEAVEGYTPTIDGYNITNKHVPEKTEVSGTKIWEDADNQDGKRPTSITVNLLADGEPVASKTVTANDGWKYNFTGLDKFKDGEEIVYAVAEEAVAGYTPEVKDYNITNIHTPETTEATVVKVWDDADNQDGKRPESLEVTLSNGTKVTLNEGNKWTATVEDLPVYEDGQKITYTWTEDTTALPEGYELTDTSVNGTVTTLTNSYEPELTDVTVKKVWDDADNQDGIRPESLAVTLSNGQSVTLNAENQWTATVENLPVYADGEEIEYTWTEGTLPEGYALTGTSVNGTITTITNTHVPELTEATVVKVWDDANNQDGKRPEELEVTLSDGTEVTLSAANNWTATVSDLPKYADGEEIEYTWTEGTLPEGYALTDTSVDGTITTLTNSYEPEVTSATVVKVWDDANNQDGIRPESLAVTLSNGQSVTLNAANNWTATVENLPKYEAGQLISYAWTEGDMPEGYALTDTSVEGTVTTLTNSYEPEVTSATVTKVWNDGDDQDGIRPDELKVALSNGIEVTLNETNGWTATVENLPVYANGKVIEYTWAEGDMPDGYTLTDTSVNGTITTITNTHTPEVTSKTVKKVWDDANNQDGKRPTELKVALSNGTEVTLNAANNWTATIDNLPKYEDGELIIYTWTEAKVDGYVQSGLSTASDLTTFTNTHVPETTEATVVKVWDDANDQDGKRPESLEVTLSNGTSVTLNDANNWTATIKDLPVYEAGKVIEYTWTEETVTGYELTDTNVNGTVTTLTNTHIPEVTEATVVKVWDDAQNQDGIRPASLVVTLSNGQSVTLNEGNEWTATINNLPVYANGEEIEYSWTEANVEGYELTDTSVDGTVTTLTNTHTPETTEATVVKVWEDADNQDGKRPVNLKVTLSDGTKVTLNEANDWTATVKDLPKYNAGVEIKYTWTEADVDGYTLVSNVTVGKVTTITNKHVPEVTEASVVKVWDDAQNQDGIRPASLVVTLSNGQSVTLNEGNEWTATINNLPVYANGERIEYSWTEANVEGYELTGEVTDGTVTTLTNTHIPETTEATVVKVWEDADNQDGKRPASLVATLSNGETVTLSEANNWTATIDNLPKYENGELIIYTWTEASVEGYVQTGLSTASGITTFKNTHKIATTEVAGSKTWNDNNNQDGVRPASITVNLLADGTEIDEATVTAENGWAWSFAELPKYKDGGKEIKYTITEDDVAYYTAEVDGYNITNTHTPATTSIYGEKIWDDNDNAAQARPEYITVELFADGVKVDSTSATAVDWAYAFDNLPVYKNGGETIVYQVVEVAVKDYTTAYTKAVNKNDIQVNIINTYAVEDPEFVTIKGTKVWNDNDNAAGKRPASITVNLFNGGAEPVATTTASLTTDWTYAFTDLPKADENGKAYDYTVTETPVPEYRSVVVETTAGFDIYNSLINGEAGQILVSKLVTGDKAPEDGVYKFVLNINAVKSEWTSLKVYELLQLEKAYEAAVKAYNDAKEAWNDAVDVFKGNAKELNTTGSVLQFAMAEEATSPSGYEYLMIDEDARMTTTSSSYYFDGCEKADEEIVNPVVEAIAKLARDFNRAGGAFLEALLGEVAVPSLGFMRDDVQDLLDEADRLFEAEALMEATSASVYEFKNSPDVTTASAVTLIITDADGNETRVTTSGAYQFEFELTGVKSLAELENEMFKFRFEAEDGTVITYSIEEVDWVKEGYEGTSIKLNGEVVASGVETDDYVLTTGSVYDFVFINDYEDETGGGYTPPPYTPPYVPPTIITPPEIEIEDPEVPLDEPPVIEPGIEIEEPEVPLGDAPRTGDATNAVPFMALMLFAMAGLVATRRRFN